jgi:multidrug transporter EmrE-like cation transporter
MLVYNRMLLHYCNIVSPHVAHLPPALDYDGCVLQAPACFLFLFFGAVWHEIPDMLNTDNWQLPMANGPLFLTAAFLGFATNMLAYALISMAGSLTLKVLCVVRNVLVIGVGVLVYADPLTLPQAAGYTISLAAFVYYTYVKARSAAG